MLTDTERKACTMQYKEQTTARSLKILWKIPEYFSLPDATDHVLNSPSFMFASTTWCLRLYSNSLDDEISVSLVKLHPLASINPDIICNFGIKLGNLGYYNENKYGILHNNCLKEPNYKHFRFQKSLLVAHQKTFAPDDSLVLICHILHEKLKKNERINKNVCAQMKTDENCDAKDALKTSGILSLKSSTSTSFKIEWNIPKYFPLHYKSDCSLYTTFTLRDIQWQIKLYPTGKERDDMRAEISFVRLRSLVPSWHEIIYTFDITLDNVKHHNPLYSKLYFDENCEHVNSILFMPEGFRLSDDRSALENDVTLLCHIFCIEALEKDEVVKKMSHKLDDCKALHQNLKNLFLEGQKYDLTVKVKDKEFRVHRHILSVRSQVFESMLTHDMAENRSNVISVPDCTPEAMEQFLLYIYSAKLGKLNGGNALEMYYLADKYNIMHLKDESREFIKRSLSRKNFHDVVQLALTHNDKSILEYAIEFSTKHHK